MRWCSSGSQVSRLVPGVLLAGIALAPCAASADPGAATFRIDLPTALSLDTADTGPLHLRAILDAVFPSPATDLDDQELLLDGDIGHLQLDSAMVGNTPGFRFSLNPDAPNIFVSWQFEF